MEQQFIKIIGSKEELDQLLDTVEAELSKPTPRRQRKEVYLMTDNPQAAPVAEKPKKEKVEDQVTLHDLANEFGIGEHVLRRWLREHFPRTPDQVKQRWTWSKNDAQLKEIRKAYADYKAKATAPKAEAE